MNETKHLLANILTILNCELSRDNINCLNLERSSKLLKLASLINLYEEIFLNKKTTLFRQNINILEIIEIIIEIENELNSSQKLKLSNHNHKLEIHADSNLIYEIIKAFNIFLSNFANEIIYEINGKNMIINFTRKENFPPTSELEDLNDIKALSPQDPKIFFFFAKRALEIQEFQLKISENKLTIRF